MQMPTLLRQRGVAVVTALLLTTLAITIVTSLFWQQQVQVRSIENQRLQLQKQWLLRSALDWTRLILQEDAKHSATDHLGEPWSVPLAETRLDQYVENNHNDSDVPDAIISGQITDAQSRYNLANLALDGVVNPDEITIFEQILRNAHQNPALAKATANMIAASQKKIAPQSDNISTDSTNVTDSPEPQSIPLTQLDDLLAIPGFSANAINQLKDVIIVLPRPTPINVNTAPAQILAAKIDDLSIAEAAALVAGRERAYFRDIGDFTKRLPGKVSIDNPTGNLSVTTSYFLVNGNVRLNRASLKMQALIERSGAVTKVIWIRED